MNANNTLFCFLAGAVTGAVVTLLFAPDSGENTRAKIRQGANDIATKARGRMAEDLESIEKVIEGK